MKGKEPCRVTNIDADRSLLRLTLPACLEEGKCEGSVSGCVDYQVCRDRFLDSIKGLATHSRDPRAIRCPHYFKRLTSSMQGDITLLRYTPPHRQFNQWPS